MCHQRHHKLLLAAVPACMRCADACSDAFAVMVSRICGILGGVLISLFLSVLIFPTSASQKATNGLSEGLQAMTALSRMAWGSEGKARASNERSAPLNRRPCPCLLCGNSLGICGGQQQLGHVCCTQHAAHILKHIQLRRCLLAALGRLLL